MLGSKGSEPKPIDVPNVWSEKRQWKSEVSAGEMLQADRMMLDELQIERKSSN